MISAYIKYFFILFCSFYIYIKLLNIKPHIPKSVSTILFIAIYNILLVYIKQRFPFLLVLLLTLFFIMTTSIIFRIPDCISIPTAILSIGISHFLSITSVILMIPFALLCELLNVNNNIYYALSFPIGGLIQLSLCIIIFRFKRLRSGMPFLTHRKYITAGVYMSGLILILTHMYHARHNIDTTLLISILFIVMAGTFIMTWWHVRITNTYQLELKSRKIAYLESEIAHLQQDNSALSTLIHKDNKLLSAMTLSVEELFKKCESNGDIAQITNESSALLSELKMLAKERKDTVKVTQSCPISISTGVLRIDIIISYMYRKATDYNIAFALKNDTDITNMSPNLIREEALSTLLADILDNAIIATKSQPSKNIMLHIHNQELTYYIDVYDSGKEFSVDVINNWGIKRTTTHADAGGNGIGLMTIYNIMQETKASFYIHKLCNNSLYAKKITVCFDGKSEFRTE